MAPVSTTPALALKAATMAAMLAVMLLPSTARCPSLAPEDLATTATTPASPRPRRCSECGPHCTATCKVSVPLKCARYCDVPSCEDCRSAAIGKCRAKCKAGGCDCDGDATRSCQGSCSNTSSCADCMRLSTQQCTDDCNSKCAATCV